MTLQSESVFINNFFFWNSLTKKYISEGLQFDKRLILEVCAKSDTRNTKPHIILAIYQKCQVIYTLRNNCSSSLKRGTETDQKCVKNNHSLKRSCHLKGFDLLNMGFNF